MIRTCRIGRVLDEPTAIKKHRCCRGSRNFSLLSHRGYAEGVQGKFGSIMILPENSSSLHTLKELMETTKINLPADEENSISCELLGEAY